MNVSKKEAGEKNLLLECLADAYASYESTGSDSKPRSAGAGMFFIATLPSMSKEKFKSVVMTIGKGLIEKDEDALKASLLFEKLYQEGTLKDKFREILPVTSFQRLDESNGKVMADCLKSILLMEELMRSAPSIMSLGTR